MSIDPLMVKVLAPQAVQRNKGLGVGDTQASFAQQLTAVSQEVQPNSAAVQADAAIRFAQLQMLQGLFAADDESGVSSDLFASLHLNPYASAYPTNSQQIDKLYTKMQPSLQGQAATGRNEIEQMIDQVAESVSLAPDLIRSVVAAESDFQPQAVSHAGAQGLMQLMPATAKELGVEDSFDPQQNLLGGSRYLKQLLDKYDGDLDKTLAAYNWGQGNVDRKGLEQMPQETRSYLQKVKSMLTDKA